MQNHSLNKSLCESTASIRRVSETAGSSSNDLLEAVVLIRATAQLLYDLAQNDHAELVRIPVLLAASQNLTQAADSLERANNR